MIKFKKIVKEMGYIIFPFLIVVLFYFCFFNFIKDLSDYLQQVTGILVYLIGLFLWHKIELYI